MRLKFHIIESEAAGARCLHNFDTLTLNMVELACGTTASNSGLVESMIH